LATVEAAIEAAAAGTATPEQLAFLDRPDVRPTLDALERLGREILKGAGIAVQPLADRARREAALTDLARHLARRPERSAEKRAA
jgi:hypothetical protein